MASKRALMVGNFLSSHGFARGVCEELAPRLRDSGWSVLTTSDRLSRPFRLADMLSTVWQNRNVYDVAHVDVYSGSAFRWAEAACWLLRQAGKPYVLTLHGGGLPQFALRHKKRVCNLLRSASAVTAPSEYLRHQMAEYRSSLILLPNALTLDSYQYRARPTVQPRLIWLRSFHEIYNPVMAVRALARLKDEFPSIHLTMVGQDKGDSSWEATIAESEKNHLAAHLELKGSVPKKQVPQVLASGDIFLNTSRVDNTPVSILEAMASGLCVVSTDVGGIPYLLESGGDALLVPIDDDTAMAGAIRRLLTDQIFAAHLQEAARTKVSAFDWSAMLPQWTRLFESVQHKSIVEEIPLSFSSPKIERRQLDRQESSRV